MAPLTKDTLEIANPAAESSASQSASPAKPASGHLRADAVSQEVSVRVHGSKVKEVVLGTTPHTEPFEEQTITMIIFPQGAVVKMLTAVNVGQMLVVTNLKTRQDAICRVIKVRPNANLAAYVEVEFTNRQPGYWGAAFPSDEPAAAPKIAPPPMPAAPIAAEPPKPAQDISWAPAAPPPSAPASNPFEASPASHEVKPDAPPSPTYTHPARPEPSFISIGSQEEVQPAASATATIKPGSARESAHENFAPLVPKTPAATEISAPPAASLSMPELRGDAEAGSPSTVAATEIPVAQEQELLAAAAESSASSSETSHSTFGSFAGGATLAAARSTSSESFGAGFDPAAAAEASVHAAPKQNWILIAACAGLLVAAAGGGFFYLKGRPASSSPAARNSHAAAASQSAPAAQPNAPANIDRAANTREPSSISVPQVTVESAPPAAANSASAAKPLVANANSSAPSQPATHAKPPVPKVTSGMMSEALNSHPTSTQRTDASSADTAATDAPALADDSAASAPQSNALPGITASDKMAALPPPTIQPDGPVRIGGNVKEPRLVSSAKPVYPLGAVQAGIEGDVVIDTTIDKNGKVVQMHVISGPSMLRQAALDSLRRWKYEPSTLDGQPVAVQMEVTIKFRR